MTIVPIDVERGFMQAAQRAPSLFDLEDLAYRLMVALDEIDNCAGVELERGELDAQIQLVDQLLMEKTESYVSVIRSLEAMSAARKVEADRLRDRAASAQKHADWLKARLLTHLKVAGRDRVEMPRFTLSIRLNNPHAEILNEPVKAKVEAYETMPGVPPEYVQILTLYKVDKRAMLADYKATGEVIPGVEVGRAERLQIS